MNVQSRNGGGGLVKKISQRLRLEYFVRAFSQPDDIAFACLRALDDRSCDDVPDRVFAFRQPEIATDILKGCSHDGYVVRLEVRTLQKTIDRHGRTLTAQKARFLTQGRKQRLFEINKAKLSN
jgi:hypothetical protein